MSECENVIVINKINNSRAFFLRNEQAKTKEKEENTKNQTTIDVYHPISHEYITYMPH